MTGFTAFTIGAQERHRRHLGTRLDVRADRRGRRVRPVRGAARPTPDRRHRPRGRRGSALLGAAGAATITRLTDHAARLQLELDDVPAGAASRSGSPGRRAGTASSCARSTSAATSARGTPSRACAMRWRGLDPVNLGRSRRRRALARRPSARTMLAEAEELTELAVEIGATYVQVLSGPVAAGRARTAARPSCRRPERIRVTAEAMRAVADLGRGRRHQVLPRADRLDAARAARRCRRGASRRPSATTSGSSSTSGTSGTAGRRPADVARLDRRLIFGVDFADSLGPPGPGRPTRQSGRSGPARASSRSGSGSTPSARPASTAGGTTSCTARCTGSRPIPFGVAAGPPRRAPPHPERLIDPRPAALDEAVDGPMGPMLRSPATGCVSGRWAPVRAGSR